MVTRAKATALVLVNWKGVFYERYLLDPNVTALEGANGAGKTTVMIGAYVVLFPDLARLRFTNVGETGATGGDRGLWGRLGSSARPSYAALQVELGDEVFLLGVHLERKTEPTLELTPFIVSALPSDVVLSSLLLRQIGAHDEVPTLDEFKQAALQRGYSCQVFHSAKDYFAKLFDVGLFPLRLGTDEERNKFNDMLRTSMTGGISRTLTSELRWFVFRQDTGLSDTLGRMRSSLSTCRRTRTEVIEARRLEQEVSSIYDAGLSMFAAGYLSTQRHTQELFERVTGATQRREQAQARLRDRTTEADSHNAELVALVTQLERTESERSQVRDRLARLQRATEATQRLDALHAELSAAQERHHHALEKQRKSQLRRVQLREQQRSLQEAVARSAAGLAHLQSGLDELHRKAHAYRVYQSSLTEVRKHLELQPEDSAALESAISDLEHRIAANDAEAIRRQREAQALHARRSDFAKGERALLNIEATLDLKAEGAAYDRARNALATLQRLELHALRLPSLRERLAQVRKVLAQRNELVMGLEAIDLSPTSSSTFMTHAAQLQEQLAERERELRNTEWELQNGQNRVREHERQLAALREQQAEFQRLQQIEARLAEHGLSLNRDREAIHASRAGLEGLLAERHREIADAEQCKEAAKREVAVLDASRGGTDPTLLALADELDGELLARRYEDVDLALAPNLEAQLGPLLDAIVVEDVGASAAAVQRVNPELADVWLVEAGDPSLPSPTSIASASSTHVTVPTAGGMRVSRLPKAPRLGRRARERQATALRKTIAQAEQRASAAHGDREMLQEQLRDLAELTLHASVWLRGDRQAELSEREAELAKAKSAVAQMVARLDEIPSTLVQIRKQLLVVRPLLAQAALIDEDVAATEKELTDEESRLAQAQQRLDALRAAQTDLASHLEALRAAPPSDEELENWSAERQGRERQRDDWCRLLNALKDLLKQKAASDWHAAEGLLSERGALAPALEEEHTRSIGALSSVEQELRVLEAQWERDTESAQKAGAEVAALDAHLSRTRLELTADGVGDTGGALEAQLTQALQFVERMDQMCASLRTDAQSRAAAAARADEQRRAAEAELNTVDAELRQLEAALQPVKLAGETLTEAAFAEGVLALVKRAGLEESFAGWGSDALQNEAHKELSLLRERLNQSNSGQRVAQELGELISSSATPSWLAVWESVRVWLAERVPTRIAESGDPLQSLSKLREELHRLEHRLVAQESELRGESRDVARNIEVQVRKATNQVRRLNQHLSRVSFGTISAIRVRLERVERMAKILEALHAGAAQSLLFHSGMPIEEAMDEIFRRYGGGRGGGQKLLDYREYLELNVEVQRREADAWERASPSRLSTGEAIGVGAALMMVILAEWERDANLLRAKKTLGTLRFLFLDEANRLSRDNLSVLFELCETLELQLLIAAPEVAQVEHNTTYRLVRRVDELGEEEVVVTGRRGTSASVPSQAPLFQVAPSEQNGERAPTGPLLDDLV